MKTTKILTFCIATAMLWGCGKKQDVVDAEGMDSAPNWIGNVSWQPSFSKSDWQYFNCIAKGKSDYLLKVRDELQSGERQPGTGDYWLAPAMTDTAWAKRKAALIMGRCKFTYSFSNYINLDGVSALTYNVSYIFSVPHKALTGLRCSDGIVGWVSDLVKLLIGAVFAVVGFFASTVLGLVCHPVETAANIFGVCYFHEGWWTYFLNTNLLASLWDLIWGGMLYPLWQMLVFWL